MSARPDTAPFRRLFARFLKEQGLPVTHQRLAVADAVFAAEGHLSVDDIERSLKDAGERIGKATIYRTLDLLVRSNLVDEHDFGEGFKRYEHRLSERPIHEHLICQHCGAVTEFESTEVLRIEATVAREFGFRPVRHKLAIYGLCAACQEKGVTVTPEGLTCPIETV
ncbi:MAG: transcriptional repressor [Gemmatimonadetes bacterium]|nr:MAG: transcriptional repressor [Gemmatimonadota bacterium]